MDNVETGFYFLGRRICVCSGRNIMSGVRLGGEKDFMAKFCLGDEGSIAYVCLCGEDFVPYVCLGEKDNIAPVCPREDDFEAYVCLGERTA
jgi:hypothetical protein